MKTDESADAPEFRFELIIRRWDDQIGEYWTDDDFADEEALTDLCEVNPNVYAAEAFDIVRMLSRAGAVGFERIEQ